MSLTSLVLSISSFIVVVSLMGITAAFCVLDIFLWLRTNIAYFLILASSLAVLTMSAIALVSVRKRSTAQALADIPKTYMAIDEFDLPQRVHKMVQSQLLYSSSVAMNSKPRTPDHMGYSTANINYSQACLQTFTSLESELTGTSIHLARAPTTTCSSWIKDLVHKGVVHPELATTYLALYLELKYGKPTEMKESQFKYFMKVYTALLKSCA